VVVAVFDCCTPKINCNYRFRSFISIVFILAIFRLFLVPKVFTKRDAHFDTPVNGIILGTFIIIALSVANFEELVEMLNFAYSLSLLMELAAFVKLRISHAHGTFLILTRT
jgi:amino acid transporter